MTTRPDIVLIMTDEERAAPPYETADKYKAGVYVLSPDASA